MQDLETAVQQLQVERDALAVKADALERCLLQGEPGPNGVHTCSLLARASLLHTAARTVRSCSHQHHSHVAVCSHRSDNMAPQEGAPHNGQSDAAFREYVVWYKVMTAFCRQMTMHWSRKFTPCRSPDGAHHLQCSGPGAAAGAAACASAV